MQVLPVALDEDTTLSEVREAETKLWFLNIRLLN